MDQNVLTDGERLARVQKEYELLVATPTKAMTPEDRKRHAETCQKLLIEKFRLRAARNNRRRQIH